MNTPVRLARDDNKTHAEKIDDFALSHANIILPLAFILLLLLFVALCYALVGISAVESGGMRNFINGGYV